EAVRQSQGDQYEYYAVSSDPLTVSNQRIATIAQEWEISLPLLRDVGDGQRQPAGAGSFQVTQLPALIVLDKDLTVQLHYQGDAAGLTETLPEVLSRVQQGEDVATSERAAAL